MLHLSNFSKGLITAIVALFALGISQLSAQHTLLQHYWQPLDGEVRAVEVDSEKRILYFGGSFTSIGPGTDNVQAVPSLPRQNLAAIDLDTGEPIDWAPDLNGTVLAIHVGDEGVYVGGNFTEVDDQIRTYLAAFNRDDHSLLPFAPGLAGTGSAAGVRAIAFDNNQVIVAGKYSTTGANPRHNLAAFDPNTGATNPWPSTPLSFIPAETSVNSLAVHNDHLYIAGDFEALNGMERPMVARLALSDASIDSWTPPSLWDLVIDEDIYIYNINSIVVHNNEVLCAGEIMDYSFNCGHSVAKFSASDGAFIPWYLFLPLDCALYYDFGNSVYTVIGNAQVVRDGQVYTAGEGFMRLYDVSSGTYIPSISDEDWTSPQYWDEGTFYPVNHSAYDLTIWGNKLIVGGNFESFNASTRSRLAVVELPCNVSAGTIIEPDVKSFCSATGAAQSVDLQVEGSSGQKKVWGLVNAADEIVDTRFNNSKFNLDALAPGDYRIGFMKYTEDVSLAGLNNLSDVESLEGCAEYTSLVTIFVRETPEAGTLTSPLGGVICSDDALELPVQISGNTGSGSLFGIIDLDASNQIVATFTGNTFDAGSLAAGNYRLYHMAYQEGVEVDGLQYPSDLQGCYSLSSGLPFTIDNCLAIEVHAFPNPASEQTWVEYSIPRDGFSQVALYDMHGRLVEAFTAQYTPADVIQRLSINTSQLPNGVYMLRINTDSAVKSEKIMVSR